MRFDDMIATVLAHPCADAAARAAAWRQLVDLLAQQRDAGDPALTDRAYATLADYQHGVPRTVRAEMARALAGRCLPRRLVQSFAHETPADIAPLYSSVILATEDWLALLPALSPPLRALLRERRDLDRPVYDALEAYGAMDLLLTGPARPEKAAADPDDTPGARRGDPSQIRDLLSRIEAFRSSRASAPPAEPEAVIAAPVAPAFAPPPLLPPLPAEPLANGDFRWETDALGMILWVDGIAREPMIGRVIAIADPGFSSGVDAQVAGAFAKRAPFRDARLTLPGNGAFSGEWRISGVPFFDTRDGRFNGFRGTGRRPRLDETARMPSSSASASASDTPQESGLYGTGLSAEALQQMAHELRTPLNAIIGFAQMIDGQLLGPAGSQYRNRAQTILAEANRLLGALEDLDEATRLETRQFQLYPTRIEMGEVIEGVISGYRTLAARRGIALIGMIAPDMPGTESDREAIERLVGRLFAAVLGVAQHGERIDYIVLREDEGELIRLVLARPKAIAALDEQALLDPSLEVDEEGTDAPRLGLGFGLRLVRQLAHAMGGMLAIEPAHFALLLPLALRSNKPHEQAG